MSRRYLNYEVEDEYDPASVTMIFAVTYRARQGYSIGERGHLIYEGTRYHPVANGSSQWLSPESLTSAFQAALQEAFPDTPGADEMFYVETVEEA